MHRLLRRLQIIYRCHHSQRWHRVDSAQLVLDRIQSNRQNIMTNIKTNYRQVHTFRMYVTYIYIIYNINKFKGSIIFDMGIGRKERRDNRSQFTNEIADEQRRCDRQECTINIVAKSNANEFVIKCLLSFFLKLLITFFAAIIKCTSCRSDDDS